MQTETTPKSLHESDTTEEARSTQSATYCPEDNKIRLYTGRLERQSYLFLKSIGFTSTPKQSCSFVATWSIDAEDAARDLIADDDDIGDEDYSPAERAADRAERFAGYREKRREEAESLADKYDASPAVFGYQNQNRADRGAMRRERTRSKSLCQWSKAEYWQSRTKAVIGHALHKQAAKFLAPNGVLVSLCYAGVKQIAKYRNDSHWTWTDLPSGSFRTEGTRADVAMIVFQNS